MAAKHQSPLSFAAQLRTLVPAVAAYKAACAETAAERRERNPGRPRDIDVGRKVRARIVEIITQHGYARVHELAKATSLSPGRISHHISILKAENILRHRGASHDGYELKRGHHA